MSGEDQDSSYKYWAFVSYSHYDMRVAKWLTEALAKKRVPPKFQQLINGAPTHFAPLFRDETDMQAASRLDDQLKAAVSASRSLIVICSPFAVASSYVDLEIQYFMSLGRADRILCLVASGEPNATDSGRPALECFPRPLRFKMDATGQLTDEPTLAAARPLAALLGEETKGEREQALRQLMAGLVGASPRDLDEHADQRRLTRRLAIGGGAFAALSAGFLIWDSQFREHVSYYRDFNRRWGVWEGVGPLSASEAARRSDSVRIVTRGWSRKPSEVSDVNAYGRCAEDALGSITGDPIRSCSSTGAKFGVVDDTRRGCTVRFKYNDDGSIASEEKYDQFGALVETLQYTGPNVATFVEAQFPCEDGRGKTGISYVTFERFKEGAVAGLDRVVRFLGKDRQPRPNESGTYGFLSEYDDEGLRRSVMNLGPTGEEPWPDSDNTAIYAYIRDKRGDPLRVEYLSARNGTFAHTPTGIGGRLSEYDAYGNETKRSFLSSDNEPGGSKPALHVDGHAGWRATKDERGNRTELWYLGLDGMATAAVKFGNVGFKDEYDASGNRTKRTYFGNLNGKLQPIIVDTGYAGWRSRFDSRGLEVERTYFATDEKTSITTSKGYAGWKATYDRFGNAATKLWFDASGRPTSAIGGGYGWRDKYDESGNLISATVIDADGNPTVTDVNVSAISVSYDERSKALEIGFLDDKGRPTLRTDGAAGYRLTSDDGGRRREKTYFGLDASGNVDGPTLQKDGCATIVSEFDDRAREVRQACLDAARKLTFHKDGFASWTAEYDALGRVAHKRFYGNDGNPALINDGYAVVESEYDERGREVATAYKGLDGKTPTFNKSGVARTKKIFNDRGDVVEYWFLDPSDPSRLALSNEGLAGWQATYDNRHNMLEQVWRDRDRQPTTTPFGFGIVRYAYDSRGNKVEISYWDASGKTRTKNSRDGFSFSKRAYDEHNRLTLTLEYDAGGAFIEGIRSSIVANQKSANYVDANGNPVLSKQGYAGMRSEIDHRGNELKVVYVDAEGRPVRGVDGIVGWLAKFDARGNRIERAFINEKGDRETRPDGISVLQATYDIHGNRLRNLMFDGAGTLLKAGPAFATSGSGLEWNYDSRSRVTKETALGPDGKPLLRPGKCASWRMSHDARGNVKTRECLDARDQLMNDQRGVAREHHEYDERDRRTNSKYFNARGGKVTPKGV